MSYLDGTVDLVVTADVCAKIGKAKKVRARAASAPNTGNRHFIVASIGISLEPEMRKPRLLTFMRTEASQRFLFRSANGCNRFPGDLRQWAKYNTSKTI